MKGHFRFIVVGVLLINDICCAQVQQDSNTQYQILKVGDKVPEYTFKNLINFPAEAVKLSHFQGKILILDFWTSSCKTCIESWPKLLKLQSEFKESIQILMVNAEESESTVKKVYEKREKYANVKMILPTIFKDDKIKELFPYPVVPWVVWINQDGYVLSITDGSYLNKQNVLKVLNKEPLQVVYNNSRIIHEPYKPLFENEEYSTNNMVGFSTFATEMKTHSAMCRIATEEDFDKGHFYATCINNSIREMYRIAYSDDSPGSFYGLPLSRVFVEIADPTRYLPIDDNGKAFSGDRYTYQLLVNVPTTRQKLQEMMRSDLKRYIGLNARMERRRLNCLVFSARDTSLFVYKEGVVRMLLDDIDVELNNITMFDLISNMISSTQYSISPYPIIDETAYKGKLGSIKFEGNPFDYRELDKGLRKFGMRVKLRKRKVEVLVISEPEGYVFPFNVTKEER